MSFVAPKIGSSLDHEIDSFLGQRDYPCVGALAALNRGEIRKGKFAGFGLGTSWRALRADLDSFVASQRASGSVYLTYFAVYPGEAPEDEAEFERALWRELSFLSSEEEKEADWAGATTDPASPEFCFHLGGEKIFVVGLHPHSSRLARRFPWPALVFNTFSQFEALQRMGRYEAMVHTNRERDRRFQGSVNPMVEQYGETWETIQFSGRKNDHKWKCPFSFLHKDRKP